MLFGVAPGLGKENMLIFPGDCLGFCKKVFHIEIKIRNNPEICLCMKKIVLDTNAYSKLLVGANEVLDVIAASDIVYMSIFVLGELYSGLREVQKKKIT